MEENVSMGGSPRPNPVHEEYKQHLRQTDRVKAVAAFPVVTYLLLLVIVGVFLAMNRAGHGDIMQVAVMFGVKEHSLIRAGEWWRLITAIFLHGSWMHLIVNSVSLLWFGSQMERIYGGRRYFLIFMAAGLAGNLLSYWMLPSPSLGASGALFGLVGAGIVFPIRYRSLIRAEVRSSILRQLVTVAGINFAASSMSPGIDNWAHLGGFIGGGVAALFLMPVVLDARPPSAQRELGLNLAVALTIAATLCTVGLQWRVAKRYEPGPETLTYSPVGPNPWWSFKLSTRWGELHIQGEPGIYWVTSDHAGLTVSDRQGQSDPQQVAQELSQYGPVQQRSVGGQPALTVNSRTSDRFQESCVVLAYGHELDFEITGPPAAYPAAHRDFEAMLASLHFAHPPPN